MSFTRLFLAFNALVFAVFGAVCLVNPAAMLEGIGAVMSGGDGIYEMRGIYGGVSLGIATLCAMAVRRESLQRPALIFLLTYMGGYIFARIVGIYFDGLPAPKFFIFIVFEAVTGVIAWRLLKGMAKD